MEYFRPLTLTEYFRRLFVILMDFGSLGGKYVKLISFWVESCLAVEIDLDFSHCQRPRQLTCNVSLKSQIIKINDY